MPVGKPSCDRYGIPASSYLWITYGNLFTDDRSTALGVAKSARLFTLRLPENQPSTRPGFWWLARTGQNVVKRRAAFREAATNRGMESGATHSELPHFSRVANQQFLFTGGTGTAAQLYAAISGLSPASQTATDVLGLFNAGTNLSGGYFGNYVSASDLVRYLWQYPREIPGVALETVMDVTMLDEMLSSVGRAFTYVGRGVAAAAARIRSWRTGPYDVPE